MCSFVFFFKQKTAYDMRISDWSSDVCSSDLLPRSPFPLLPRHERAAEGPLRITFLSRISPMKNLLFCLETLARVHVPVVFTIYGPREDHEYWQRCEAAITALPSHVIEIGSAHV